MRIARSLGGRIEAWSYLDKVPVDVLIQDADLAAQCFMRTDSSCAAPETNS